MVCPLLLYHFGRLLKDEYQFNIAWFSIGNVCCLRLPFSTPRKVIGTGTKTEFCKTVAPWTVGELAYRNSTGNSNCRRKHLRSFWCSSGYARLRGRWSEDSTSEPQSVEIQRGIHSEVAKIVIPCWLVHGASLLLSTTKLIKSPNRRSSRTRKSREPVSLFVGR